MKVYNFLGLVFLGLIYSGSAFAMNINESGVESFCSNALQRNIQVCSFNTIRSKITQRTNNYEKIRKESVFANESNYNRLNFYKGAVASHFGLSVVNSFVEKKRPSNYTLIGLGGNFLGCLCFKGYVFTKEKSLQKKLQIKRRACRSFVSDQIIPLKQIIKNIRVYKDKPKL